MIRPAFLLVDLREFYSVLGSRGQKKSAENGQLTGHFQSFFNISRTNSKTSKVNQQSVLNFQIFHIFPKTVTVSLAKKHRQNLKNILFFPTKQIKFRIS